VLRRHDATSVSVTAIVSVMTAMHLPG